MPNLLFQKILGSDGAFSSHLQYFGRSLDGFGDLNGDSITDVSVGAFGQVVQLWWVHQSQTQTSWLKSDLLSRTDCCVGIVKMPHTLYKTPGHLCNMLCIREGMCFPWWEKKNICLTLESSFSSLCVEHLPNSLLQLMERKPHEKALKILNTQTTQVKCNFSCG